MRLEGKTREETGSAAFFIGEKINSQKVTFDAGSTTIDVGLTSNEIGGKTTRVIPIIDFEGAASIEFNPTLIVYGVSETITPTGVAVQQVSLTGAFIPSKIESENQKVLDDVISKAPSQPTIKRSTAFIIAGILFAVGLIIFLFGLRRRK